VACSGSCQISWEHDGTEIWLVLVDCSLGIRAVNVIATPNLVHML